MAVTKRKANKSRALVFNPTGRSLSIGGSKGNPRHRRRKSSRRHRHNPVSASGTSRRKSNPFRRKNPVQGVSGLVTAAVMTAVGVSIFDLIAMKVLPNQQGLMRTGVKAALAWVALTYGKKVPIIKGYSDEIALVLAVLAATDLLKLYVYPLVGQIAAGTGINLIAAPPAGDGTTQGIYDAPNYTQGGAYYA